MAPRAHNRHVPAHRSSQPRCRTQPCHKYALLLGSPSRHCSSVHLAAPGVLDQELHRHWDGGGAAQASPCATIAGSHPDPAAGRGHGTACAAWPLPLPVPNQRVWWLWAGLTPSWCLQPRSVLRETLLLTPVLWTGQSGDCPQATELCTRPRQGTHCRAHPLSLLTPSAAGAQIWGGRWGHRLSCSLVMLPAADQGIAPQSSAPHRINPSTAQSPEPMPARPVGEATTAPQHLHCTAQPCRGTGSSS